MLSFNEIYDGFERGDVQFLKSLESKINNENAPFIIGAMNRILYGRNIELLDQESLDEYKNSINKIKLLLKKFLSEEYHFLLLDDKLNIQIKEVNESKSQNIIKKLSDLFINTIIYKNKAEIDQKINYYSILIKNRNLGGDFNREEMKKEEINKKCENDKNILNDNKNTLNDNLNDMIDPDEYLYYLQEIMDLNDFNEDERFKLKNENFINIIKKYIPRKISYKMIFSISLILNENNIQNFMNFILSLNYKKEENLNENCKKFLNNLELLFMLLKRRNPLIYEKMMKLIYSEKRYFKEVFLKNIHHLNFSLFLKYLRPYNFDVLGSLFYDRGTTIIPLIIESFKKGEILFTRKIFIQKIVQYDEYFKDYLDLLTLENYEMLELCEKSEILKSVLKK